MLHRFCGGKNIGIDNQVSQHRKIGKHGTQGIHTDCYKQMIELKILNGAVRGRRQLCSVRPLIRMEFRHGARVYEDMLGYITFDIVPDVTIGMLVERTIRI